MATTKNPYQMIMERKGMIVCKVDGENGREIVVKIKFGSGPDLKNDVDREKVALWVLKGLAVPKLINVPRKKVARMMKEKKFFHLGMEWIPGQGCWARSFPAPQALALWLFTVEQMCAFRRKKVLYTDFKHNHLRITEDFSSARIVDFDACVMVDPKGLYPTQYLGHTPELAAPEFHFSKVHSERIIVYQMGMFLGALLIQYFHNSDIHLKSLKKIKAKLSQGPLKDVYKIFEKTIAARPVDRPRDLEVLFGSLEKIAFPQETYAIWNKLRAPFEKELKKLKFKKPGENTKLKNNSKAA